MEDTITLLCQILNLKLVNWLGISGEHKRVGGVKGTQSKDSVYQVNILNMLQEKDVGGLVAEESKTYKSDRLGVVVLIQILSFELQNKLLHGLQTHAEKTSIEENQIKALPVQDVNRIFGWAVFHLRLRLIDEKRNEFDGSPKARKLTRRIKFLSEMRMYATEAVLSEEYMKKYYNGFFRAGNRGYLTLISEKYCGFGLKLMDKLSQLVTQTKLQSDLGVVKSAKENILSDKVLQEIFLKSCNDDTNLNGKEEKLEMYAILVSKAANARFCDEFRAYREAHTVRGCKKNLTGLSHRQELKAKENSKLIKK